MAIYLAGTSIADVVSPSLWELRTTASRLAPYVSEGISALGGSASGELPFAEAASEFWFSIQFHTASATDPRADFITFRKGPTEVFRFTAQGSAGIQLQYWDGSAWQNVGTPSVSIGSGTVYRLDAYIRMDGTDGQLVWYVDGVEQGRYDGDTVHTAALDIDRVIVRNWRAGGSSSTITSLSAWLATDFPTLGVEAIQRLPTGNGNYTQWTGDYQDVDGTGLDTATFVSTAAAAQRESFTKPDLSAFAGWSVLGVCHVLNARAGAGDLATFVRYGGADYDAPPVTPLETFGPVFTAMETLPSTATPFSMSDLSTSEFGLLSVAA